MLASVPLERRRELMQAELLVLRLVHVLGGIFWVGSGLFTSFFLLPSLTQVGPAAGPVMMQLQKRKLFVTLPIVAIVTMLSGLRLMAIISGGFSRDYFATTMGKTYAVSGIAAIVAFLLSLIVARPAAIRAASLSQLSASDGASKERIAAELRALQRRAARSSVLAVALLLLSAAGMAIARYL
jgi:uncharacterized membrane protein